MCCTASAPPALQTSVAPSTIRLATPPCARTSASWRRKATSRTSRTAPATSTAPRFLVRQRVEAPLRHLLSTFFEGSPDRAVAALLDETASDLTDDDLDRLATLVDQARRQGR